MGRTEGIVAEGKWIPDLTADLPVEEAAERVLFIRTQVVLDCLEPAVLHASEDVEHVHRLRVSTRRAGAALAIFRCCLPRKHRHRTRDVLRLLRRAAGAARDWDVFLAEVRQRLRKPPARHAAGLEVVMGLAGQMRIDAQQELVEAANPIPSFAQKDDLALISNRVQAPDEKELRTLGDLAHLMIGELLDELDEAAEADLDSYDALHQVRIRGKRLRYAMEVFGSCFPEAFQSTYYAEVERMQEILGLANDSHVAERELLEWRERLSHSLPEDWKRWRPGMDGLVQFHRRRLTRQVRAFQQWWRQWRKHREKLRELVRQNPGGG